MRQRYRDVWRIKLHRGCIEKGAESEIGTRVKQKVGGREREREGERERDEEKGATMIQNKRKGNENKGYRGVKGWGLQRKTKKHIQKTMLWR